MDNIILVKELAHSIAKSKTKIKPLVVKIDVSKAYDSIEWHFIQESFNYFGFSVALSNLIMCCIHSYTMQVLWEGYPSE